MALDIMIINNAMPRPSKCACIPQGRQAAGWLSTPAFYGQAALVAAAFVLALPLASFLKRRIAWLSDAPDGGRFAALRALVFSLRDLMRPLVTVALLAAGAAAADALLGSSWLVRLAQSLSLVLLLIAAIRRFMDMLHESARHWRQCRLLDESLAALDQIAVSAGNIRISLLFLAKAALAGGFFFWLGRQSNAYGQRLIGKQEEIAPPTRALFGKLFEITLFALIGFILLQVLAST